MLMDQQIVLYIIAQKTFNCKSNVQEKVFKIKFLHVH